MQLSLELSALLKSEVLLCHCMHLPLVSHSFLTSFGTTGSSCMGKLLFWISGEGACLLIMMIPQSEGSPAQQKLPSSVSDPQIKGKFR